MTRVLSLSLAGVLVGILASACSGSDMPSDQQPDAGTGEPDAPTACEPEELAALCAAKSYTCGDASFTDRCGNTVAGSCGTCSTGTCSADHACVAPVPAWEQVQWPSGNQTRIITAWNTPGSSTVWMGGGFLGAGELWKITGLQLQTFSVPGTLSAMHGTGTDLWGVGSSGLVVHTVNGSLVLANNTGLSGYNLHEVFSFGPNDVWVTTNGINSAAHWNGTTWALHMMPSTAVYADCAGLWGAAPNDVWAVCTRGDLIHWDGTAWTKATSPTTETLQDIYGFAANDIWAVGNNNTLLHYNGTSWSRVTPPTSGALIGLWGSAPNDVYAVGSKTLGGGRVLHYNGSAWTEVLTTTSGEFDRITGTQGRVWAVGYPALLYTYN